MKTIFKGVINGKEFDSVQAYNDEMLRAISAGESIQASSQTETVDETEVKIEANDQPDIILKPYFDLDDYYLDTLVDGSSQDECRYSDMMDVLDESFNDLNKYIKTATVEELVDLVNAYAGIIKNIKDDKKDNKKILNSIQSQLQELNLRKTVCDHAKPVMEELENFYQYATENLERELENRKEAQEEHKCNCSEPCINCTCKETNPQRTYNLDKLLKTIFG